MIFPALSQNRFPHYYANSKNVRFSISHNSCTFPYTNYHSGFQTFFYGRMGEVIENNHTFVLPNETYPYSFKMQYTYDSWKICASRMKKGQVLSSEAQPNLRVANRVRTITYPDGEVASYEYGMGGMPKRRLGMGIAKRIEFPMPHNLSPFNFQFSPPPARYYHSDLSIWLSVDPMSDKYPNLSPYTYCGDNPVRLVDPDGRTVITEDKQSRSNICNTLTIKEAKYVKFDKNGVLNDKRLQRSKSTSENITALKALSHSDTKYHFQVAEKTHSDECFSILNSNGEGYEFNGVTEIPGAANDPSPNNDVWIITSSLLDEMSAVENTAHEGYGHAYFYELQQQGVAVSPFHEYVSDPECIIDDKGMIQIRIHKYDANSMLDNQIWTTTRQAKHNYNSRK